MDAAYTHPDNQGLRARIGRFFYQEEIPYGLAVVRILMPLVLLVVMVPRWFHARELYSSDGAPAPLATNYGFHDFLPVLPGVVIVALASALIFFLITSCIGWRTRFSLTAATVLYVYLNMQDCLSSLTKYSVIAAHVMLLLSLSNCGSLWSVDRWLSQRSKSDGTRSLPNSLPRFPAWPRRLMQLLIGLVYFGAALTKMHTPTYFSGDQIRFWMMTNVNNENPMGEYLSQFPPILVVFAYIAIVWEVAFVFLAWKGWNRIVMLSLGVVFHIMTTFTLGLYIFPLVSITAYFSFLEARDVERWSLFVRNCSRRLGFAKRRATASVSRWRGFRAPEFLQLPSPVLFSLLTVIIILAGIEAEHLRDPYGLRRAEGAYTLQALDDQQVSRIMRPTTRIRNSDKIMSFDIGTELFSGILLDNQRKFRQGESLIAQVTHCPPHEDMWVECNLHDSEGRMLDRVGQVVARDAMRSNFTYQLTDALPPGEYSLVLKTAGEEISRRKIQLAPGIASPVAN